MTYAEFLEALAGHVNDQNFYLCSMLDGEVYHLDSQLFERMNFRSFLNDNQLHVIRLKEAIREAIFARDETYSLGSTLSETLGYRHEGGVEGRQNWLRALAREARIIDDITEGAAA